MVMSLSFTEAGEQVRGSSEFYVVHVQPVLGPLNDTSLLVIYNNCKYYQKALFVISPPFSLSSQRSGRRLCIFYRSQGPMYLTTGL